MKYFATIAGRERTVDVEPLGGSQFRVTIDGGAPQLVDAVTPEPRVVSLLVRHESHDVDIEEDGEALNVLVGDDVFRLELLDERKKRMKTARGKSAVEGRVVVKAPMPGKVVKVLVAPGDAVAEGQGVIIIEAMKMENELRSPRAGKVGAVFVKEGQAVEGKAELVVIE
jgi:biotin carboxyl carrier protein